MTDNGVKYVNLSELKELLVNIQQTAVDLAHLQEKSAHYDVRLTKIEDLELRERMAELERKVAEAKTLVDAHQLELNELHPHLHVESDDGKPKVFHFRTEMGQLKNWQWWATRIVLLLLVLALVGVFGLERVSKGAHLWPLVAP